MIRRIAVISAVTVGAAVGSFAISSALSSSPSDDGTAPILEERPDIELLLPPTEGNEPEVFSGVVSNTGDRLLSVSAGTITLVEGTGDQLCTLVVLGESQGDSCYDLGTVKTGLAVAAFLGPEKIVHVVGVVPDDVALIRIDGREIRPDANVWYYAAPVGTDLSFEVESADGLKSVTLGHNAS